MRVQNRFGGMRDTKNFRGGIRDETFLAGPGCLYFRSQDAGSLKN